MDARVTNRTRYLASNLGVDWSSGSTRPGGVSPPDSLQNFLQQGGLFVLTFDRDRLYVRRQHIDECGFLNALVQNYRSTIPYTRVTRQLCDVCSPRDSLIDIVGREKHLFDYIG